MIPSAAYAIAAKYHHAAERTIPSMPGGDGSTQRIFVPSDLDL